MRVQFCCTNARLDLDPYREYCAIGLQNCIGCQMAELRTVTVTANQMIKDEKYATTTYDFTSGRMERTW